MRIKVACPSNTVTGGIELLHQFASECNKHDGVMADIWYLFTPLVHTIPSEYAMYNTVADSVIEKDDILLFPEIWAHCTNDPKYKDHKKIVYWESVDNYFPHTPDKLWFKFGENTIHLAQSEYSKTFLTDTCDIDPNNIVDITDYINDIYLDADINCDRDKVVLYNPVKGMEYTSKLIKLCPEITFVPIKGMNRSQIIDRMTHSMVWIDFGNFPGKDRLPREAGACGMVLITGKRGSSKYQTDMNLQKWYKIDNITYADLGEIRNKIHKIFDNFETHQKKFASYRTMIQNEKAQFADGVSELLKRL